MEQSDDQSNYTCSCQHCGGHIKFEASQLRKGETRTIECPHCHLDTILFVREQKDTPTETKSGKPSIQNHCINVHNSPIAQFELFVLQLTRILTLGGAALVIATFTVATLIFIWSLLPHFSRPQSNIKLVSYEEIAETLGIQSQSPPLDYGSQINTEVSIPAPVAAFVRQHPDIKLDTGLMVNSDEQKAFLSNLSDIIQQAQRNRVSDDNLVRIVSAFESQWNTENNPLSKAEVVDSQKTLRAFLIAAAPGLFIAIAVLCLILVLLGIERSVRTIAERLASAQKIKK